MIRASKPARRRHRDGVGHGHRARCLSCGAPARAHPDVPGFCDPCLDWSRQTNLAEWDELGVGD